MSYNNQDFVKDLDKAPQARNKLANLLSKMQNNLTQAELFGNNASGKLGLETDIGALCIEIDKLRKGTFRILVLGEMKRGKSTFLNALLGEKDLLPTDVNPCTAILTILRYGTQKKVTVHFNDGQKPTILDFNTFKQHYTIKEDEAIRLEKQNKKIFSNVDYAVVEYPLEILSKGVEIVDSPGLNDTKERDAITLDYIANCHAILYVLSATQQFNQNERDYLKTRIQGRGLAVFFLINGWDEIESKLYDRNDLKEVANAKKAVRNRFAWIISDYLQSEKRTDAEKWIFEISSLNALRYKIQKKPLDGTGFPELTKTLVNFLNRDRLKLELLPAVCTSQVTQERVQKAIQRRIPLLSEAVEKLEQKIKAVEPQFDRLTKIRNDFEAEITQVQQKSAEQISQSLSNYVRNLATTFDLDFVEYQPELKDNTEKERQKFLQAIENAFGSYLQYKIFDWYKKEADRILKEAFLTLAYSANRYLPSYIETTDKITNILLEGQQKDVNLVASPNTNVSGNMSVTAIRPSNINDVQGITGGFVGGILGLIYGGNIGSLTGLGMSLLPQISSTLLSTVIFAPIGILVILGSIWGVREARKDHYVSEAKRKLKEQIPNIASAKADAMYKTVRDSFSNSLKLVQQMDDDIKLQKDQLNNLLEQKRKNQVSIESEKERLAVLGNTVTNLTEEIIRFYNQI